MANTFSSNIVTFIGIAGIMILFMPQTSSNIYGYSTIFFSLVCIILILISLQSRRIYQQGLITMFSALGRAEVLPILLFTISLGLLITINVRHYDKFNNPAIMPSEFNSMKSLSSGLIIIAYILVNGILNKTNMAFSSDDSGGPPTKMQEMYKAMTSSSASLLYIVIVLFTMLVVLMNTILKYYITDG